MHGKVIVNCHTHIFTFNHVPSHFIPGQWFILKFFPWTDRSVRNRFSVFLRSGNVATQEEVFARLCGFYPSDASFAVHSIDFDYMAAGGPKRNYLEQLTELAALKRKYPQKLHPFFCADPRRPDLFDLFRRCVEQDGFCGIKLFPPMGFFPFDERLYPLFDYAQKYELPVMTHCSASGPVFGRKIPPPKERIHPKTQERMVYNSKKSFGDYYTDPQNYRYLLSDFPKLKICFAHFGGDRQCEKYYKSNDQATIRNNWFVKIMELLEHYPNTYADISYASADLDLLALFNAVLHKPETGARILFGSDYYMSGLERNERWFSMNVRMNLGEDQYMQIAHTNALKYLSYRSRSIYHRCQPFLEGQGYVPVTLEQG